MADNLNTNAYNIANNKLRPGSPPSEVVAAAQQIVDWIMRDGPDKRAVREDAVYAANNGTPGLGVDAMLEAAGQIVAFKTASAPMSPEA